MENDLKGNENWFELAGGSSWRGFELSRVDCIIIKRSTCENGPPLPTVRS